MRIRAKRTALAGAIVLACAAFAHAADPVGVLTEIRAERGQVEVKRAGETRWTAAQPLLALRPGDQLRVTGEARAALVFTGGRGAQAVSAGNSPFTVLPPAAAEAGDKVKGLVGSVTDFLSGKQKDLAYLPLSVRSVRPPRVAQLEPRTSKILPGAWGGSVPPITQKGRHSAIDDYLARNPWRPLRDGDRLLDLGCGFLAVELAEELLDVLNLESALLERILLDMVGSVSPHGGIIYWPAAPVGRLRSERDRRRTIPNASETVLPGASGFLLHALT